MHNSLKEKILEAIDIVDVIGERIALTRKGREFVGLCPFHPDKKPSMNVSPTKQIFKCFACGAGGDAISFVQRRDGLEFREALALLANRAGIELNDSPRDRQNAAARDQIRAAVEWARKYFQRNLADGRIGAGVRGYAQRRGLSDETLARHGLGLATDAWEALFAAGTKAGIAPDTLRDAGLVVPRTSGGFYDKFRNRLMFPINDALGRTVAFGGRTLGDDPAKYMNSPETVLFSKSRILYGFDVARKAIEEHRQVVVVEGYMDAVLLHQYGVGNVVATLGTELTDSHLKLIRPLADSVLLCFDGDDAGARAADRAVETALSSGLDVRVVIFEDGIDPADCVIQSGTAGFQAKLQSAVDALQFKWSRTVTSHSDRGPRGRRLALEEFLRFVASVSAAGGMKPLDRGLLVGRLSELLSVPATAVHEMLGRATPSTRVAPTTRSGEIADVSVYDESIAGLPPAVIAAVEELFGLLLRDAACFGPDDDTFAAAAGFCDVWKRLHGICATLADESDGRFSQADVLARCESAALCELCQRACARTAGVEDVAAAYQAAHERLASELDVLRIGDLRGDLLSHEPTAADAADAFRTLLEASCRQHAALPADVRLNSSMVRRN